MVITILIVEGRHDAAFIGRILLANGYYNSKLKIGDYPDFIRGYLSKLFDSGYIEDYTIKDVVSSLFLPSSSLSKTKDSDDVIVIFAMGGDSQKDRREKFIKTLWTKFSNPMFHNEKEELRIIYNLDADTLGIIEREQQVHEELCRVINPAFPVIHNETWAFYGNIVWGLYVFADAATGKGKLEDLIIPLLKEGKEDLQTVVNDFIEKRPSMNYWDTKYHQYDEDKARISIMCQLEISGAANTTLISKTGLIKDASLQIGIYKSMFDYLTSR